MKENTIAFLIVILLFFIYLLFILGTAYKVTKTSYVKAQNDANNCSATMKHIITGELEIY